MSLFSEARVEGLRRVCATKTENGHAFLSEQLARNAAWLMALDRTQQGGPALVLHPYRCPICVDWHLTHNERPWTMPIPLQRQAS